MAAAAAVVLMPLLCFEDFIKIFEFFLHEGFKATDPATTATAQTVIPVPGTAIMRLLRVLGW